MSQKLYEKILVPTDLSEPSIAAVKHAGALAGVTGARIILVYVMDDRLPPVILAHTAKSEEELIEAHRLHALEALEKVAGELLADRDVDCEIRRGVDHQQIVALARQRGVDLIVLGMHGHGFLVHALSGSTTERVLHHAPCPVLVVGHDH